MMTITMTLVYYSSVLSIHVHGDIDEARTKRLTLVVLIRYMGSFFVDRKREGRRVGCGIALLAIEGYDEGGRVQVESVESLTDYALFIAC